MKGSVDSVLPLVMGVIIAGAILMIGFGIMGKAKAGVEDIWNTGASYNERMDAMTGLAQACDDWLTGAEKYNANAILETYKLVDRMRPYTDVWEACGRNIEELAQKCYSEEESDNRNCAGSGYLIASNDDVQACLATCSAIKELHTRCRVSCENKLTLCFETLLQQLDRRDLARGDLSILSARMFEDACD